MFLKLLYLLPFTCILACSAKKEVVVKYSNPQIAYTGRIDSVQKGHVDLYWPGSSIEINFQGESIEALLEDERGDNYYNVIIDHDSSYILYMDSSKRYYELASSLAEGNHTVELFKRTEWQRGKTSCYEFKIKGDSNTKLLSRTAIKKRKIEFFGNSITSGYAVEDTSGKDSPDSIFTNNYKSYAAITARHFDAQYHCTCRSGIGIMISWFPLVMPEMYNRLIPTDPNSRWDFSLFTPDVVVINLFQNDSYLVNKPERREFKEKFDTKPPTEEYTINAYYEFLKTIRATYPEAQIICALGNMNATKKGSKWPGHVQQTVERLDDPQTHALIIPFKGTSGHPSLTEQEAMAESLISFIDKNIDW